MRSESSMFSRDEVDVLFNDASRVLQRSQLLLEERSRGAPPDVLPVMPKSPSFEAALRSLREFMNFTSFLDASEKVGHRLREESRQPSPAMERKRRSGSMCPLLRRVVDGLAGVEDMLGGTGAAVGSLWEGCALVTSHLVLAGLFADWVHGVSRAMEERAALLQQVGCGQGEVPRLAEGRRDDLLQLLSKAKKGMPEEISGDLDAHVVRVACSLPCGLEVPNTTAQLTVLLLFPTLIPYIVQNASPSLATAYILEPLERAASGLLSTYLSESSIDFSRVCGQLVQHVVLVGMCTTFDLGTSTASAAQSVVNFTKRLFDALLMPVEASFASALPRVGMTLDVHQGLAEPLCRLLRSWAKQEENKSRRNAENNTAADSSSLPSSTSTRLSVGAHRLTPVWCTASYRALVIVESLAHAEIGIVSGRGNAAAQQKKYYSMFQQSNGRVTTSILSAVTEDRQLIFEETTARSMHGHKVYRIHEGSTGPSVYVYIDNGIVYMKVGRERVFRRAKSMEDVFSVFLDLSSQN